MEKVVHEEEIVDLQILVIMFRANIIIQSKEVVVRLACYHTNTVLESINFRCY